MDDRVGRESGSSHGVGYQHGAEVQRPLATVVIGGLLDIDGPGPCWSFRHCITPRFREVKFNQFGDAVPGDDTLSGRNSL